MERIDFFRPFIHFNINKNCMFSRNNSWRWNVWETLGAIAWNKWYYWLLRNVSDSIQNELKCLFCHQPLIWSWSHTVIPIQIKPGIHIFILDSDSDLRTKNILTSFLDVAILNLYITDIELNIFKKIIQRLFNLF